MSRQDIAQVVLKIVVYAGIPLLLAYIAFDVYKVGGVRTPDPQPVAEDRVAYLGPKQNWNPGWKTNQSDWFHHANQGTRILPYSWFISLEQPDLSPFHTPGLFHSSDYLERFGFLPSVKDHRYNPDGLPIGFTIQQGFRSPLDESSDPLAPYTTVAGLTCAACHTGQLNYKDKEGKVRGIRIEGGSAMISLGGFQEAVSRALFFTDRIPARFTRFARGVLTEERKPVNEENMKVIRRQLGAVIEAGLQGKRYAQEKSLNVVESGFSRTDALGLIGNRVFGRLSNENLDVTNAPVNFPHLWDTSWFDWVQYNGSIRMPMVRNIGEALGVGAVAQLDVLPGARIPSSVNVENLRWMEDLLGGPAPYAGLRSPQWSDTGLPPIDPVKRDRGRDLYRSYCQACHLPPTDELALDLARKPPLYWYQGEKETKPVLGLKLYDLQQIGTDPNEVLNFYRRVAVAKNQILSAAMGLYRVTGDIRTAAYQGLSPEEVLRADRFRKFDPKDMGDVIRVPLGYKARPLNGIWATPPYLHNSAVPNLYELLVPAREPDRTFYRAKTSDAAKPWRSPTFYLGTKLFDPVRVGYETDEFPGGFLLDTSLPGNSNLGHEYRNLTLEELEGVRGIKWTVEPDPSLEPLRRAKVLDLTVEEWGRLSDDQRWTKVRDQSRKALDQVRKQGGGFKGVLGAEFTEDERQQLVEYQKSL